MSNSYSITFVLLLGLLFCVPFVPADEQQQDFSPKAQEQQLPRAMHSEMKHRAQVTVGRKDADFIGHDHRVLQAAVDYVAGLGGGTVKIGPGEFLMHDSLHLRNGVTVRGTKGTTILRKSDAAVTDLAIDGDFGEQQITVKNPEGFRVGYGVAIMDKNSGGFHVTVARLTGRRDNHTFSIDQPMMADYMIANGAKAATVFPVVSGYNLISAKVENLIIAGNKENNIYLTGCRGAGIFLYRGYSTVIKNCQVYNFNGDGISFQQSNDVQVTDCTCQGNTQLGLHPGSGSQRPLVRNCIARGNGTDGLFLCWRVRHGLFENNILENNGRFGISIGHKDSDNLLQKNQVRLNANSGVFFRNESLGMAAHRNRLVDNLIENNGTDGQAAGIRIRGQTNGLIFEKNVIRDTREGPQQTQKVGVLIEEKAGKVVLKDNKISAQTRLEDRRKRNIR